MPIISKCPECGDILELQDDGTYYCPTCNNTWDEDEVIDIDTDEDEESEDNVPKGCQACGGPYPYCKTSCKLFDD